MRRFSKVKKIVVSVAPTKRKQLCKKMIWVLKFIGLSSELSNLKVYTSPGTSVATGDSCTSSRPVMCLRNQHLEHFTFLYGLGVYHQLLCSINTLDAPYNPLTRILRHKVNSSTASDLYNLGNIIGPPSCLVKDAKTLKQDRETFRCLYKLNRIVETKPWSPHTLKAH